MNEETAGYQPRSESGLVIVGRYTLQEQAACWGDTHSVCVTAREVVNLRSLRARSLWPEAADRKAIA